MARATIRIRVQRRVTVHRHVRVTRSIGFVNPHPLGWEPHPALPDDDEPEDESPDIEAPEAGTEEGDDSGDASDDLD